MGRRSAAAAGLLAAAAVVACAGAAFAARGGGRPPPPAPISLSVSGDVEGLFPGADTTIPVTITNPFRFAIQVISLDVDVADATPDCPGSVLTAGPTPTGSTIAGKGSVVVDVPLAMSAGAPDSCQGAVFALSYAAAATKAR